ncbi:MAG: hypothetical protein JSW41_05485, partial [Candidatus Aenigmatarchaeota archaeon]
LDSALVIHNKGCAATTGTTTLKETISSGWTPGSPSIEGNVSYTFDTDWENNILTWEISSPIDSDEHVVATYQIKSPVDTSALGTIIYNLTWDGYKKLEESQQFLVQTMNYTNESHLEFDIDVYQRDEYPWPEARSIQPNITYNYSLKVTNIGDVNTSNEWNVTLTIPTECNATNVSQSGSYNNTTSIITWELPDLEVTQTYYLNFTLNCTETGKKLLYAQGIRDTTGLQNYENITSIDSSQSFTFTHPNQSYQELSQMDFLVNYNFTGTNLTIGEGFVNITDDSGINRTLWQNYSFVNKQESVWSNYTVEENEQFSQTGHYINIYNSSDATVNEFSNVTIEKINYTWSYGRLFQENQTLFTKVKEYIYVPLIENATVNASESIGTTGGWGEDWNFTVMVRDRFKRNVTVRLWHRSTDVVGYNTYQMVDEYNCTDCENWTQVNMTFDYNYSHIGNWYFFFNATNDDGVDSTAAQTYRLEEDDVNVDIIYPLQYVNISRNVTTNFTLYVNDTDNRSVAKLNTLGKIWISVYDWTQIEGENIPPTTYWYTNDTGYLVRTMANDSTTDWESVGWCSDKSKYYLGVHRWKGGTHDDDSYIKENITNPINFTLWGSLNNTIFSVKNQTKENTTNMTITGNVTDDCGDQLSSVDELWYNLTHEDYSYQCNASLTNFDCDTFDPNKLDPPTGWYNITMFSRKSYHWNGTTFTENAFFLATTPDMIDANVTPSAGGWGESPFNFTVNITDEDNTWVNVTLWLNNGSGWVLNGTDNCTSCDNTSIYFEINFTKYDVGGWQFRFDANDTAGFGNTSSGTFTIQVDNLTISLIEGGSAKINRSDSRPNHNTNLSVQINDTDLNNYTIDFTAGQVHFYVENETDSWKDETESNTSEYYYLDFNATCEYVPGNRSWQVNVTDSPYYENKSSSVFYVEIYGDMGNRITSPDGNTNYSKGSSMLLRGNVSDDCSNNITNLDADGTIYFNLTNDGFGVTYQCNTTNGLEEETNGWYNCSWDSTGKEVGWYNITMYTNRSFYNINTTNATFYLFSGIILEDANVTPNVGGWGASPYNYTVNVTDEDNDTVIVELWLKNATDN